MRRDTFRIVIFFVIIVALWAQMGQSRAVAEDINIMARVFLAGLLYVDVWHWGESRKRRGNPYADWQEWHAKETNSHPGECEEARDIFINGWLARDAKK